MKFSKNASLNLSVNAIVVFVLAFAMLGVGLFITNMIREKAGETIGEVFNVEQLEKKPTSQDPITLSRDINLKKGKLLKLSVGYYNTMSGLAEGAKVGLSECLDENGDPLTTNMPVIVSPTSDVSASEAKGFEITIRENKDNALVTGTYICTMIVYNSAVEASAATGENVYESKQFFLNVVS